MSELREEIGLSHGVNGFPAQDHDGGLACIGGEFPSWLGIEEISNEYWNVQEQLEALHNPPVASISPMSDETTGVENYRAFVVEFEPEATAKHVVGALQVVAGAIRRLREERGRASGDTFTKLAID